MISKFLPKSMLIFIFLMLSPIAKAQEDYDVFIYQMFFFNDVQNNNTYFYKGNINLKNNEVLKGEISLNHKNDGQYFAVLRTKDSCQHIPNKEIENIILIEDKDNVDESTRFVSLKNKRKLYRELYVKDYENAIYDLMEKPFNGKTMNDVYVLENNNLISTFNIWHSGPKADLLNYFKARDQKKYRRRDFKNLETLFAQL